MYEKIIIALLLSDYVATPAASYSTEESEVTTVSGYTFIPARRHTTVKTKVTTVRVPRQQKKHVFSEPVIIGIIFAVIAGVVGIILLMAYLVGLKVKKTSHDVQPPSSQDTGVPLSSVETENPEK